MHIQVGEENRLSITGGAALPAASGTAAQQRKSNAGSLRMTDRALPSKDEQVRDTTHPCVTRLAHM